MIDNCHVLIPYVHVNRFGLGIMIIAISVMMVTMIMMMLLMMMMMMMMMIAYAHSALLLYVLQRFTFLVRRPEFSANDS